MGGGVIEAAKPPRLGLDVVVETLWNPLYRGPHEADENTRAK